MHKPVGLQLSASWGAQLGPGCLVSPGTGRVLVASSGAVLSLAVPGGAAGTVRLPDSNKAVGCLAYSSGAACLAVGEAGFKPAVFVHCDGQQAPLALRGHNFGVQALAFSPASAQGVLLASTGVEKDRQLLLWSPVSGAQLGKARLDEDLDALEFLDDKTLCGANGNALSVWTLEKGVAIGRTPQCKLVRRRYSLELPPSSNSGGGSNGRTPPARVVGLAAASAGAGAPSCRRVWAALDSGLLLLLRSTSGKPDKVLDTKAGRLVHMAASSQLVACSTASGGIKLYNAASLEEVCTLTWPGSTAGTVAPVAVSVSFSPCGTQLSALFANGGLCTWDCAGEAEPALLESSAAFHCSPIADATLFLRSGQPWLATCSQNGLVQLQRLEGAAGQPSLPSSVDLRQQQGLGGARLCSLAISPNDGALLAAGDASGRVHLFSCGDDAAPGYLHSLEVHSSTDTVSAVALSPPLRFSEGSCQLLAVGAKSGALAVLDVLSSGNAPVAELQQEVEHVSGVVGLQWGPAGVQLLAAFRDGRVEAYSVHIDASGHVSLSQQASYHPAPPKGHLVCLSSAVWGQVAAACSKEGGVTVFDADSGDDLVTFAANKSGGEVTGFALDEGICIAAVVTSKNLLQIYDRNTGTVLASCKAHLFGSGVNRLLVTPDTRHIVTAGEDASIRVWRLPESIRQACLAEQQRLRQTVQLMCSAAKPAVTAGSREQLSPLNPHNLFEEAFQQLSGPEAGAACSAGEDGEVSSGTTAGSGGSSSSAEALENAPLRTEMEAHKVPPMAVHSAAHHGGVNSLADQFGQLEAQLRSLKAGPLQHRPKASQAMAEKLCKAAQPSSHPPALQQPAAPAPAAPAAGATSPLADYLRSSGRGAAPRSSSSSLPSGGVPAGRSPQQLLASSASAPKQQKSTAGGHAAVKHQPWLSPREGSGLWVDMSSEDELAAVEAQRCQALLHCSEDAEQAAVAAQAAAALKGAAVAEAADVEAAQSSPQPGEAAAARPESASSAAAKPPRSRWDFSSKEDPKPSVGSRRPLSSLATKPAEEDSEPPAAARPNTALGIEGSPGAESFTIWADAPSPGSAITFGSQLPAQPRPGSASGQPSSPGGRLTFSFGQAEEQSDTPSFAARARQLAAEAAAPAAGEAPASSPASKPSLAFGPTTSQASTPSLNFKKPSGRRQPQPGSASVSKPAAQAAAGLQGGPPVPRLTLPGSSKSPRAVGSRAPLVAAHSPQDKGHACDTSCDSDVSLREQYSARGSAWQGSLAGSPPSLSLQPSRLSLSCDASPTGYATAASSTGGGSDSDSDSSSGSSSCGSDGLNEGGSTLLGGGVESAWAASEHSSAVAMMDEEEDAFNSPGEKDVFSSPSKFLDWAGEGLTLRSAANAAEGPGVSPPPTEVPLPSPTQLHINHLYEAAADDAPQAADLRLSPISLTRPASAVSSMSNLSAWDHPAAYDPLEALEPSPDGASIRPSSQQGRTLAPQRMSPVQRMAENGLYGFSPSLSQATTPFTTHNAGSCGVPMTKNPLAASPLNPSSMLSPSNNAGVGDLRRISDCLPTHPAAQTAAPAATASLGTAPAAGSRTVTPAGVLQLFQQAVQGLQQLQAEGRADSELMGRLRELGIVIAPGGSGESGRTGSAGSRASAGSQGENAQAALSGADVAALKAAILQELRSDIAAGALRA